MEERKKVSIKITGSFPKKIAEDLERLPWGLKSKVIRYAVEKLLSERDIDEVIDEVLMRQPKQEKRKPQKEERPPERVERKEPVREEAPSILKEVEEDFKDFMID
jgi:Arc/MetJ-type ribon-helix-helix transcriptional regulator